MYLPSNFANISKERRWETGTVLIDLPGTYDTITLRPQIKTAVYCIRQQALHFHYAYNI